MWIRSRKKSSGGGGGNVQIAKGTFTSSSSQHSKTSINCGFKPDYVIVEFTLSNNNGYTYAIAFNEPQHQHYTGWWDLRPTESSTYSNAVGTGDQSISEAGVSDILDDGFKFSTGGYNTVGRVCNYTAIKYVD